MRSQTSPFVITRLFKALLVWSHRRKRFVCHVFFTAADSTPTWHDKQRGHGACLFSLSYASCKRIWEVVKNVMQSWQLKTKIRTRSASIAIRRFMACYKHCGHKTRDFRWACAHLEGRRDCIAAHVCDYTKEVNSGLSVHFPGNQW